jgi:hypothetical protein
MTPYPKLLEKMRNQKVFFMNTASEMAMKSLPGIKSNFFMKGKGCKEYPIDYSTDLVSETLLEDNEITEREYDDF